MSGTIPTRTFGSVPTPLGPVLVIIEGGAVAGLHFDGDARTPRVPEHSRRDEQLSSSVADQLEEYFRGIRTRFELPLRVHGTPFQRAVWSALLDIPYGQTSTYGRIAAVLGRARAARAVGAANGQNPVSIVIPCHRLIGTDGGLTGYGGGIDRKRRLLELEAVARPGADRGGASGVGSGA